MLFNSLVFWIFFPTFFVLYFLTKGQVRMTLCLVGSYLFYGWWDWRFLGLIALLTGINYWCGLKIAEVGDEVHQRKHYVTFSIVSSLAILGFFKYFDFFMDSFYSMTQTIGINFHPLVMGIVLPVGISFYTFQTMSYTIDLYRKEMPVERSLLKFSVFVSFFPQLVAGPIVRAKDFLPQLQSDRTVDWENLRQGINKVLWGLILKVVMADNLAITVDRAFAEPSAMSGLYLLIGAIFYGFQIYGDFAGYSLIAIGLAQMLGYHFNANFNRPYLATSFSDFWKRWHISLSSWLRDYLYIPLGGNRKGKRRTQINLMLTMLLGGLWHGSSWNFVLWGGLHGFYLIAQRWVSPLWNVPLPELLKKLFCWFCVMVGVFLAWIFFRVQSFHDAAVIIEKIATLDHFHPSTIFLKLHCLKGALILLSIFAIEVLSTKIDFDGIARKRPSLNLAYGVVSLLALSFLGMYGGNAFIYFQF